MSRLDEAVLAVPTVTLFGWRWALVLAVAVSQMPPPAEAQTTRLLSDLQAVSGSVFEVQTTPNGGQVVYLAEHEGTGRRDLYAFDLEGRQLTRLNEPTVDGGGDVFSSLISPDSNRVIYQTVAGRISVNIDGSGHALLGQSVPKSTTERKDFKISSDSSRVLFLANPLGQNVFELFSEPIEGGFAVKLNVPPTLDGLIGRVRNDFQFVDDPVQVVYRIDSESFLRTELYAVALTGGPSIRLSHDLPADRSVGRFAPRPESSKGSLAEILYQVGRQNGSGSCQSNLPCQLYKVSLTGGSETLLLEDDLLSWRLTDSGSHLVYTVAESLNRRLFSLLVDGGQPADLGLMRSSSTFLVSPDEQRVAYLTSDERLVSAPLDGSAPFVSISDDPVIDFSFSVDSSRLVYLLEEGSHPGQLFSALALGGESVQLNLNIAPGQDGIESFAITADSGTVIYFGDPFPGSFGELFTVPIEGGSSRRVHPVLQLGAAVGGFHWNPEAGRIFYWADRETLGLVEIYEAAPEGGVDERLSAALGGPEGTVDSFAVGPDGQRVVYVADQEAYRVDEIFSVAAEGGLSTKLNDELVSVFRGVDDFRIDPSSRWVVYESGFGNCVTCVTGIGGGQPLPLTLENGASPISYDFTNDGNRLLLRYGGGQVVTLPPDGSEPETPLITASSIALTPDGQRVVYISGSPFSLFVISIDGGLPTHLTPDLPEGEFVPGFVLTPDGSRVIFEQRSPERSLRSVSVDGGPSVLLVENTGLFTPEELVVTSDSEFVVFREGGSLEEDAIFSVPVAGGQPFRLDDSSIFPTEATIFSMVVSPSGSPVLYAAASEGAPVVLVLVSITGGFGSPLCGNLIQQPFKPPVVFSPDGSYAVFSCRTENGPELRSHSIATGVSARLAGSAETPKVDPTGRFVYYLDQSRIFRVPLTGGATEAMSPPSVIGGFEVEGDFVISADGESVFYRSGALEPGRVQLYRGDRPAPFFADGFETGNTSRWSSSVGQ